MQNGEDKVTNEKNWIRHIFKELIVYLLIDLGFFLNIRSAAAYQGPEFKIVLYDWLQPMVRQGLLRTPRFV